MDPKWIVFASILLINSFAAAIIAVFLTRVHKAPGRKSLLYMTFMLVVWSFSYALITLSTTREAKLMWLRIENIGILTTPIFWLFFTLRYNRLGDWLNGYNIPLFFIIPGISLFSLLSERWFHLYYASVRLVSETGGPLAIERGPWYVVQLIYSYLLGLVATVLLLRLAKQYQGVYREQMYVLIGAAATLFVVNILYQAALSFLPKSVPSVDLTPIFFTVSVGLISIGLFKLRIFNLIPIARHTVFDYIPEMVFVVDARNIMIDANLAAQRALGKNKEAIAGRDPREVFHEWPQLLQYFLSTDKIQEEIKMPGDPPRTLEVNMTALRSSSNRLVGKAVVAHDVTERKWLENDLIANNETLTSQLKEIEKLRRILQEQAIRDPLTSAYNRRYMVEFLTMEIARAKRDQTPFSIIITDMDNFKMFNDAYGHKCGDVILRETALFFAQRARKIDAVCRFGGEEFVILMPGVTLEEAYEQAEIWRQSLAEYAIVYEGIELFVTFSAGVASYPQHGSTDEALLQAADRALYRSKETGKNKVTVYDTLKNL
ncbi:MAG: hypothetical protein B6D38_06785 [Anaerolineae bacterium UTCFX1]|jgi:diguanylate cyclase (GGDEF)-like protein/PAS domain S-box-containing protein|nr:MAG: hypothetical protein B6D38_06785 [Anaerolineae bacterium UTCFX1]